MDNDPSNKKYHRLSMNTSLKDARIFDDDAWEEGENGVQIKKEHNESMDQTYNSSDNHLEEDYLEKGQEIIIDPTNIKKEPEVNYSEEDRDIAKDNIKNILDELNETPLNHSCTIDETNIKKELEEAYLGNIDCKTKSPKQQSANTPFNDVSSHVTKLEQIKEESELFNESPFNKELFKNLNFKEQTPVKETPLTTSESSDLRETLNGKRSARKSVKRTIFTRSSPYKRTEGEEDSNTEKRMSAKSRLGPKMDESNIPAKKNRPPKEVETDPEVLSRRQKQIDYGKNTSGYDHYMKTVPRIERQRGDPQTPDKYAKYSRRGWEGLIKQWRIRLHKYDPSD